MEYAQDEDIFFHLENMLYQLSLNFNTLMLRNTPKNKRQRYKNTQPLETTQIMLETKRLLYGQIVTAILPF